jgi:hypothetical protein
MQFLYWIYFLVLLVAVAVKMQRVVLMVGSVVVMTGVFAAGLNVDEAQEHATMKRVLLAFAMLCCCFLPFYMPLDAHCGTCLGKHTPTRKAIDKYVVDCAMHKSANQQLLGKNNDLENHKTTNGGIARKHPECYDDIYAKWDPCDFEEFTWISLSCMKD